MKRRGALRRKASFFTIHGNRVTACCASNERRPIKRRGRICGIAECIQALCVPYSVFRQMVLGRASFEIQSGVRFFHVGRTMNKEHV